MRRSVSTLIATVVAVMVLVYIHNYVSGAVSGASSSAAGLGAALGAALSMPYQLALGLGAVFSGVAFVAVQRWAALTGAILFAVSMVLLPAWLLFSVVPTVLGFIGYARMGAKKA